MAEKATYTHGHHSSVVSSHSRRTVQDSAAFLIPHIKSHHHILDLGCGPGSITLGLARLVPQGHVIGGDAVEDVLIQARALAEENDIGNVEFRKVDGNQLPFEDGTFDVTYAHQVLQHVGDPVAILKEMKRVTKVGGVVAVRDADYRSFAWYPELPELDHWREIYEKTAKANGAQPNAGRYMKAWAREAGFAAADIDFTWDIWNYQGEQSKAFARSWKDRILHSGVASSSVKKGFAKQDDLEKISHGWDKWSSIDDAFIIIPNGEILCHKK